MVASEEAVNDGDGEGVGGVVGLGDGVETEVKLDHGLDLGLVGLAVAADGFFDLVGGVFVDGETVLLRDEEADAAGFGDGDAGGNVLFEEEFFDGYDVGMVGGDNFVKGVVNVLEAVGKRSVGRGGDDAIVKGLATTDDAEAANAGTWVDAEDAGLCGRGVVGGASVH